MEAKAKPLKAAGTSGITQPFSQVGGGGYEGQNEHFRGTGTVFRARVATPIRKGGSLWPRGKGLGSWGLGGGGGADGWAGHGPPGWRWENFGEEICRHRFPTYCFLVLINF